MATNSSALKETLANENMKFKELYNSHQQLENLLNGYNNRPFLSNSEELEVAELKKKKLYIKDQMHVIMQGYKR